MICTKVAKKFCSSSCQKSRSDIYLQNLRKREIDLLSQIFRFKLKLVQI